VAVTDEATRGEAVEVAATLRGRGIPVEVAPAADKFGRQIRYADRRGIPYVWFGGTAGEVKDIRTGDQNPASALDWAPPLDDLTVTVSGVWA
jgi:histidyl-tRNA synthetase